MLEINNENVPASIQKDPINTTTVRNHGVKVNSLPDSNCVVHEDDVDWGG